MEHFLNEAMIDEFRLRLEEEEKSSATIDKYIRDVRTFFVYAGVTESINKTTMIAYKEYLITKYAAASVNSMLTSVNIFLKEMNWHDCVVKILKIQKEAFRAKERDLTKEEYYRLVRAAEKKGNIRLSLIMQTIGSTGIRISELKYITVAAINMGYASVCSKGKRRTVLLPEALCQKLKHYVREKKIQRGSIFVTRTGKNVDRSNVCHEMKALGREAGVMKKKIFPHNLRHLFALTYYSAKKDISHLADLLGHSNINTTRIYTMTTEEQPRRQMSRMRLVLG